MKSLKVVSLLCAVFMLAVVQAQAETLTPQMLGVANLPGTGSNLCQIDAREGTNINFNALDGQLPPLGATFPPGDDCAGFICFEIPLVNPGNGTLLGSGVDCLRFEDGTAPGPESFKVAAVSFFVMPGGTLVTAGRTSVLALSDGWGNGGVPQKTHATGSIPTPGAHSVIAGTGEFAGAQGMARVSGAVGIGAEVSFDCLWHIELFGNPGESRSHSE
jgi:hypothetical protein